MNRPTNFISSYDWHHRAARKGILLFLVVLFLRAHRFYARMLGDGLRPAATLRAAQMSMPEEKRWQLPYYWAGITFEGEWK